MLDLIQFSFQKISGRKDNSKTSNQRIRHISSCSRTGRIEKIGLRWDNDRR